MSLQDALFLEGVTLKLAPLASHINFGSQHTGVECFVLGSGGVHSDLIEPYDCVIEDCIALRPGRNNVRETTVLNLGGGVNDNTGRARFHRSCVLRNNYSDTIYQDRPVAIAQIELSGGVATVTTLGAHGRVNGQWVVISGALVDGDPDNGYNGSYVISNASGSTFQYTPLPTPTATPSGEMYLGRFSSHAVGIKTLMLNQSGGNYIAELETWTPHNRVVGDNVLVQNVKVGPSSANAFNGAFEITAIPSARKLQYVMTVEPGEPDCSDAFTGARFQGLSAGLGEGSTVEGNRVYHCAFGGPYQDTHSTQDILIRNNFYHDVVTGPFFNLNGFSPPIEAESLTHGGADGKLATFTTEKPHGLRKGQLVRISNARISGNQNNPYNGDFGVDSVPSSNTFTYSMATVPIGNADGSPAPTFESQFEVARVCVVDNLVELTPNLLPSGYGNSRGIDISGGKVANHTVFDEVIVCRNVIRMVAGSSPKANERAIVIDGCAKAIIESNVVDFNIMDTIKLVRCVEFELFNNRTSAGELRRGFNNDTLRFIDELETRVEDDLLLSLI